MHPQMHTHNSKRVNKPFIFYEVVFVVDSRADSLSFDLHTHNLLKAPRQNSQNKNNTHARTHAQTNRRDGELMMLMMMIFILRMQIKIINKYTQMCQSHALKLCERERGRVKQRCEMQMRSFFCDSRNSMLFQFNFLLCTALALYQIVVVVSVVVVFFDNAVAIAVSVAVNRPC